MQTPSALYRSVKKEDQALENHLQGKLWFRSPRCFREMEGSGNDELEGRGGYELKSTVWSDLDDDAQILSMFALSFSETPGACRKFGNGSPLYLVVREPEKLAEVVRQALPERITEVGWQKMEYTKTMSLESHPKPVEDWNRKFFSKPVRFAEEQEWRLCIYFCERFPILNETLKLGFGNLRGVLDFESY